MVLRKNGYLVILILIILLLGIVYLKLQDKEEYLDNNTVIDDEPKDNDVQNKDIAKEIYQNIYLKFDDNKDSINLATGENDVVFELKGKNDTTNNLYYEINISLEKGSHQSDNLIFSLTEMHNNVSKLIDKESYHTINNRIIYIDSIMSNQEFEKRFKLQVINQGNSIDDRIVVDVNISTNKKELLLLGKDKVLENVHKMTCNPLYIDNMNTTSNSDDITYFSGNDCVNNNYVWYSGKLWRIVAIYPDGTMKLITDGLLTTINWGKTIEFNGSWVYQWLNEDFYNTLDNPYDTIVANGVWDYSMDTKTRPIRPNKSKVLYAPVGLLSAYEYSMAYQNTDTYNNYLNVKHYWWLLTPYNGDAMRSVGTDGKEDLNVRSPKDYARGIRPCIYLKSNVHFSGAGTKSNPYQIDYGKTIDDKTLLNTRTSGEFVSFNNELYRIIDTTSGKTKIIKVDYLRDGGKVINKHIAGTIYYGHANNFQNAEYWDYYLNNIWFNSLSANYKKMVVEGTYYLGAYNKNTHYKATICRDGNLDSVKTNNCNYYSASDNRTYTGKVGLSRIGEMFSAQQLLLSDETVTFWTLTPFDNAENRIVLETNALYHHLTFGGFHAVHPTLYLDSGVRITKGTGYFNNPYYVDF